LSRLVAILLHARGRGGHKMSRRTYGLIAGLAGAILGAWFWRRRTNAENVSDKGTVIFDNTPPASSAEGVI
jgi:hypothetical protein